MDNYNNKKYLTPKDIAQKLQLNLLTIYGYIRKKKLVAIRINKNYRIDEDDFERFIEANKLR
jgi:excisionase family DNA binding protein